MSTIDTSDFDPLAAPSPPKTKENFFHNDKELYNESEEEKEQLKIKKKKKKKRSFQYDVQSSPQDEDDEKTSTIVSSTKTKSKLEFIPIKGVDATKFACLSLVKNDIQSSRKFKFTRDDWIAQQLTLRTDEYTEQKTITIFVTTYNVNAKKLKIVSFENWFDFHNSDPNIVIVGFQEIVDLNATNVLSASDTSSSLQWTETILEYLNANEKKSRQFEQVACIHLVGLALLMFSRKSLASLLSDIRATSVGTGLGGFAGNKGATCLRFNIGLTSFCVVNAHLAAHQKNIRNRNGDYWNILRKTVFPPGAEQKPLHPNLKSNRIRMTNDAVIESYSTVESKFTDMIQDWQVEQKLASVRSMVSTGFNSLFGQKKNELVASLEADEVEAHHYTQEELLQTSAGLTIYDHDHILFIGDLNYRLNFCASELEECYELIKNNKWKRLIKLDQLTQQKALKHVFVGFQEGKIEFQPTYKYTSGTSQYDAKEGGKQRIPSYCDRIQYCSVYEENIKQLFYNCAMEMKLSDHKPVISGFELPYYIENFESKDSLMKELISVETYRISDLGANSSIIDLKDVRFDWPSSYKLTISNSSDVLIGFDLCSAGYEQFVQRRGSLLERLFAADSEQVNEGQFLSFLVVSPMSGVLFPNSSVEITISTIVERTNSYKLQNQPDLLRTPILVYTDGGMCFSFSVSGNYKASLLGLSIEQLCRLNGALRPDADSVNVYQKEIAKARKLQVPFCIWKLVAIINKFCASDDDSSDAFTEPVFESYVIQRCATKPESLQRLKSSNQARFIIECFDTSRIIPINEKKLECKHFVESLCYIMHNLPEPLFNLDPIDTPNESADLSSICYTTFEQMSDENKSTFNFILLFFRQLIFHHEIPIENILQCFSSVLMHRSKNEEIVPGITPLSILHFAINQVEDEDSEVSEET